MSLSWEGEEGRAAEGCKWGELGPLVWLSCGVPGAPPPRTREAHPRTMSSPYLMGSSPGCASSLGEESTQEPWFPGCWRSEVRGDPTSGFPSSTILAALWPLLCAAPSAPRPCSAQGPLRRDGPGRRRLCAALSPEHVV